MVPPGLGICNYPVTTLRLGLVKRVIGAGKQRFGGVRPGGRAAANTDTDGQMKYLIGDPESCFLNLLADSLGDPNGARFRSVWQQDDKLLAAVSRGQILRPDGSEALEDDASAPVEDGAALGEEMARRLLERAGDGFFDWR